MATQSARGPESKQPYCETETESDDDNGSDDYTDSDEDEDEDGPAPTALATPANVGTKRSDPAIAQKKNKYATSDSGYSSLTATTASSSQSKKAAEQPSKTTQLRQKLAQTLKLSTSKPAAPAPRPSTPRRMSRHDRTGRELRSVESREEAARMSLSGVSNRATTFRRPSQGVMPGGYPPSPNLAPVATVPRAIPRQRASTATQAAGPRPQTYHGSSSGSAPGPNYTLPYLQTVAQPIGQHIVLNSAHPAHHQQQQYYYQSHPQMQAMQMPVASTGAYYSGAPYAPSPGGIPPQTSGSPHTPGFSYPYPMSASPMYQPPQPQHQPQPHPHYQPQPHPQYPPQPPGYWPSSTGYPGAVADYAEHPNRRMSMGGSAVPSHVYNAPQYSYEAPPPAHLHQLRRMSQTVHNPAPMFRPPSRTTPVDEGVFFDEEDPDDYYRGFVSAIDREMMPPPMRPQSSQRTRPPMIHSRTTSMAHPTHSHRLSRGSIEYAPEISPRKASFERPPSRPGMQQRVSTSAAHQRQLVQAQHPAIEPPSPIRQRPRGASRYGPDVEPRLQAAQAYQDERVGGMGSSVAIEDIGPRRIARTSDTGSKGSRGSGGREAASKPSKRTNRHSLDRSRISEQHEGVSLTVAGVHLNLKEGSSMTIKQSNEAMKPALAAAPASRPSSTKPTRDTSRVRPEKSERPDAKRYVTSSGSTRSSNKDRAEIEVPRKQRRSSSVQPRVGRDGDPRDLEETSEMLRRLRLENQNRASRTSSRTRRAVTDR